MEEQGPELREPGEGKLQEVLHPGPGRTGESHDDVPPEAVAQPGLLLSILLKFILKLFSSFKVDGVFEV